MSLNRDEILALDDLKFDEVEVLEWGGTVRIRELSGKQRTDLQSLFLENRVDGKQRMPENYMGKVAVWAIVNDKGKRLFTDDDAAKIGDKNHNALERVFKAVSKLSALTQEAVDEAEKNFSGGLISVSGSDSQENSEAA